MALFKIAKGSASNLSTSTISKKPVEGYCWFTTDDGRFYIDTSTSTNNAVIGTNRIAINGVHTASNSWTAGSSAGPTLSITINDITSTAAAIPSASATASGIVTTGNQTFAGRKTMDLISPSVYDGTGDTSRYRRIYFKNNSGTAVGNIRYDSGNATNVTAGQFTFFEYSPKETPDTGNNGHTEAYSLPNVTSGLTTDKSYKIITTKNPEDLGYYLPLSGGTMTGTVKLVSGSSVYAEGNPMFYWLSGSTSSYQKQAAIFTTASTVNSKKVCDRMYFREYSYNSTTGAAIEYWDQYRLPVVTADKTSSDSYEILTSKSAVTIAQGGTSATTAGAAANNLLLGLPTWTANPTDDTYFIRRDTGGGDAFGQVKASTIYNYIAGKTTVSNTWTAGTTAGPTIKTTVNGVAGTAVAIPSASKTASGVVTTDAQSFLGRKTFGYMNHDAYNDTGTASRYGCDTQVHNAAGNIVAEYWYDIGDATNVTSGRWGIRAYSPNSTANTTTTGKYETFYLPNVNTGRTDNASYNIITTKNPGDLYWANINVASSSSTTTEPTFGLIRSTKNSNTTTIGSQNANFCHIYNSVNIPFIFNNSVLTTGGNLGNSDYPFDNLTLGRSNGAGIYYKGTKATYRMIRFIDNTSDTYGNGISIGGGGQTIIGGGESADTAAAQAGTAGAEIMQVCNDGDVQIISNLQNGWDSRKVLTLNTSGYLMCPSYINVPTNNNENPTLSQFIVTNGSDHYYRKASAAHAMAAIRSNASGSWGISITGNAATATKANGLVDGTSTMTSAYNKAGLAYADYSWLAGWNGYELRAVAKTQFAQASHSHAYLPLAGGTMNDERAITFQITRKKNGGGGWAYSPIRMVGNDNAEFAGIGVYGGANTMTYMYIGANAYNGNNLYIYPDGHIWATKVYGAVWNDYAEFRTTKDIIEPGRCVIETGKDDLVLSTARLQPGAEIVSDTFGFAIGETDEAKTPIATTGRVLAYIYEGREAVRTAIGKPVCSGPDGTVSIMTDEEYQKYGYCAIGTISAVPDYEEWGTENIKVNNRIWIRIR